jgi:DMSO/TMAO reductase YedYZ molybdopterin-dependent catalytic subunit
MSTSPEPPARGLILRGRSPLNLEFPFERLDGCMTPNDLFYVRSHFPVPEIAAEAYRLEIGGAVARSLTLTYRDLLALPRHSVRATLECAGNSRIHLTPPAGGVQWDAGAVSTAEWTGVRLCDLLQEAGVAQDACEVVLEGADRGTPPDEPRPPQPISYARSLPLAKALASETLVAYAMNGEELTPDHGFPVRAIVPGYYGMASTKWLTRIQVTRRPFMGYFQVSDYAFWDEQDGLPTRAPLGPARVKALIARPVVNQVLQGGARVIIAGAAWTGDGTVTRVEVSTDGGAAWADAAFLDPAQTFVWRRWEFPWEVPRQAGRRTLMARAHASDGSIQPAARDGRYGSYVITHTLPVEVVIKT